MNSHSRRLVEFYLHGVCTRILLGFLLLKLLIVQMLFSLILHFMAQYMYFMAHCAPSCTYKSLIYFFLITRIWRYPNTKRKKGHHWTKIKPSYNFTNFTCFTYCHYPCLYLQHHDSYCYTTYIVQLLIPPPWLRPSFCHQHHFFTNYHQNNHCSSLHLLCYFHHQRRSVPLISTAISIITMNCLQVTSTRPQRWQTTLETCYCRLFMFMRIVKSLFVYSIVLLDLIRHRKSYCWLSAVDTRHWGNKTDSNNGIWKDTVVLWALPVVKWSEANFLKPYYRLSAVGEKLRRKGKHKSGMYKKAAATTKITLIYNHQPLLLVCVISIRREAAY